MKLKNFTVPFNLLVCFFILLDLTAGLEAQEEDDEIEVASERLRLSYVDPVRCIEPKVVRSKCGKP